MTDILKKILEEGYLGKTSDREVAKMYGIDPRTVSIIRSTAGIPVFSAPNKRTGETINGVDRARLEQVIKTVEDGVRTFGDRQMAMMYAAKKEGLRVKTVRTYLGWAKGIGLSMSSDIRPKDHKSLVSGSASRLDAIEKMLINVATTQTTILSTLRNKGIIE